MINFNNLFLWSFFAWVAIGIAWLLPKKVKLIKRIGFVSNAEIIKLAQRGDSEAKRLKRLTTIYIIVGLLVLIPLKLLSK